MTQIGHSKAQYNFKTLHFKELALVQKRSFFG